jgi:hypothetical protein
MCVACADLNSTTMGRIREDQSSISPQAFNFLAQEVDYKLLLLLLKCSPIHIHEF